MSLHSPSDSFGTRSRRRLRVCRWDGTVVFCGVEVEQGNLDKRSPHLGGLRTVYTGMTGHTQGSSNGSTHKFRDVIGRGGLKKRVAEEYDRIQSGHLQHCANGLSGSRYAIAGTRPRQLSIFVTSIHSRVSASRHPGRTRVVHTDLWPGLLIPVRAKTFMYRKSHVSAATECSTWFTIRSNPQV